MALTIFLLLIMMSSIIAAAYVKKETYRYMGYVHLFFVGFVMVVYVPKYITNSCFINRTWECYT